LKKLELFLGAYESNPSNFIPTGINTYEIKYHVTNMVSFFEEEDGFYYNVTGSDWDLPIDKIVAEIALPNGATINSYSGYSGKTDANDNDYIAEVKDEGKVYFETTRPFNKKEGFTVSVSFTKGFVDREKPVTSSETNECDDEDLPFGLSEWKKDGFAFKWRLNNPLFWALVIPVIVFIYYFSVWFLYGRDFQKETVVPNYIPPRDISPIVGARLLGFSPGSEKEITAILISLINKKYVSLNAEGEKYKIALEKEKTGSYPDLADDEKAFFEELHGKTEGECGVTTLSNDDDMKSRNEVKEKDNEAKTISLDADAKYIYRSYRKMRSACSRIFSKYIVANTEYKVWGVLLTLAILIAEAFFSIPLIISVIPLCFAFMPLGIMGLFWYAAKEKSSWPVRILLYVFTFFGIAIVLGILGAVLYGFAEIWDLDSETNMLAFMLSGTVIIGSVVFTLLINLCFFFWLKKKTKEGEKATASIKGLYEFIDKVEKDRYTKITPDIFERNLAYAVIFGFEEKWMKRFAIDCNGAEMPSYYRHLSSPSFHMAIRKSFPATHSTVHSHSRSYSRSSRGGGRSGRGGGHGGGRGR